MKFSLNWLKELTPFTWSLDELVERLTMAGVEVEGVDAQGAGLDNVVVAQILKFDKHPNADRLSVCEVDSGNGIKQIVCGAKNFKVLDKVPLAVPGAKLPCGIEIKKSKLRGVESDGMMCSTKELGLAGDAEGLLILSQDLKVGTPIKEALGLGDTLLELEITPNRPDLLSHWGMAREIAAIAKLPPPNPHQLLSKEVEQRLNQTAAAGTVPVKVEDLARCPRYTARVIRDVKVGPSPAWLKQRLESLGHRSISNVVDITNYIIEEIGQPLHAFDLDLLKGPAIIVRGAREDESLLRLDDATSKLKPENLVIADAERAVALAGIMGGKETGVSEKTTNLLLESATFQPSNIRKSSKTLATSSDSSYRFERGVDIELAAWASLRATAMILEICGGQVDGPLVDVRSPKTARSPISCRYSRVRSILGTRISAERINQIFTLLGCQIQAVHQSSDSDRITIDQQFKDESCDVVPPTYRPDLEREIDLIEEIARVHGIQNITGTVSPSPVSSTSPSESYRFAQKIRGLATGLGLNEASHYTLVASPRLQELKSDWNQTELILANPLSSEMDTLRPSLFLNLLDSAARNLAGGNPSVALFEWGKVFDVTQGKVTEHNSLGIVLAGQRQTETVWRKSTNGAHFDFYDLKGLIEEILARLHRQPQIVNHQRPELEVSLGFELKDGEQTVGWAGKVRNDLIQHAKIPVPVFVAEINGAWLQGNPEQAIRYKTWSPFPAVRRDVAMTLSASIKHQTVENLLKSLAQKHATPKGITVEKVELFDVFESEKLGSDKKSLAYSLTYRGTQGTLKDLEINEIHGRMLDSLKSEIQVEIRQ